MEQSYIFEIKFWPARVRTKKGFLEAVKKLLSEKNTLYLSYFNLKKGYILRFNFNKKKKIGVKKFNVGDRVLVEAVV